MDTSSKSTNSTTNEKYKASGFSSKSILKNMGFIFLGLIALAVAIGMVLLMRLLLRKCPVLKRPYQIVSRRLFFNMIIRALTEAYLKLCISTFISLLALEFTSKAVIANSVFAIFFTIWVIFYPVFIYAFLRKFESKLEIEDFKGRFMSFYLNVDTSKK